MNDSKRKSSTNNGTVEQLMRNMTSDRHSADGQYIQLGFTAPQQQPNTWNMPNASAFAPGYIQNDPHYCMEQFPHQQTPGMAHYKYPAQMYGAEPMTSMNQMNYNYQNHDYEYKNYMSSNMHHVPMPEQNYIHKEAVMSNGSNGIAFIQPQQESQSRSPILENLVGNWAPNMSGTYSPFGNTSTFNATNLFDQVQDLDGPVLPVPNNLVEKQHIELDRNEESINFQFARDTKKPRMVAEVKPMRPSYSDVLLKSVPAPVKNVNKNEAKDAKVKKDLKKNSRNEAKNKPSATLNRSNTSNEISKEAIGDKNVSASKNSERNVKEGKSSGGNLNRKWASLDNVSEGFGRDFKNDLGDKKAKPKLESKNLAGKSGQKKVQKSESNDTDSGSSKIDLTSSNAKSAARKTGVKVSGKPKNHESFSGGAASERPQGKRSQRNRKKENPVPFGIVGQKFMEYSVWWKYVVKLFWWLLHLVADVFSLSTHLSKDLCSNCYSWLVTNSIILWESLVDLFKNNRLIAWLSAKFKKEPEKRASFQQTGLPNNINMPATGEEAMKRLLACKGKDPYSILGVTPACTDADIKNYYKKQAKLVHPDKNQQPGAEEAFKILVHAFNMIGEPERRGAYDRGVAESAQAEQAMTELTELLVQLQRKVEAAANTIRCSACGLRHKRVKVERPTYAARNCTSCKIHHGAREGDIWAEAKCFGFMWSYFACMEGGVYDITEWAGCQKESLKHLKPDSHNVQYRIALGKQTGSGGGTPGGKQKNMSFLRNSADRSNADLNSLFNNFYGQNAAEQTTRRRSKKTK